MREHQTAPVSHSPSNGGEFSPDVALALLRNVRAARAILRTVILAICAQDDGAVSYDCRGGMSRWQPAMGAVNGRLALARDALIDTSNKLKVDWFTPVNLAEALDAALWYEFSCADSDRLDSHETVAAAQAVIDSLDNMLRDCEAEGVNQIASLSHVSSLH